LTTKQLLKIVIESEGPTNTHYLKYTNEDLVYSKNHKVFEKNTNMNTYQQTFHLSRKLEDDWKDARDPSSKMHLPNSTTTKRRLSGSQEKNIQYVNSQSSRTSSNNR
ncbi:11244_t:CDS:1, partial [Cetraspora pellucida]